MLCKGGRCGRSTIRKTGDYDKKMVCNLRATGAKTVK